MKPFHAMLLAGLLAAAAYGAEEKAQFVSKEHGITMAPPEAKDSGAQVYQIALFYLPAEDGFAANVNVQKQPYADTMEAYDKLSVSQFEALKITVLKRTLGKDEILYEYKGTLQGAEMHFYSRAIKKGNAIILTTATALEASWEKQKAELVKSVDSVQVAQAAKE